MAFVGTGTGLMYRHWVILLVALLVGCIEHRQYPQAAFHVKSQYDHQKVVDLLEPVIAGWDHYDPNNEKFFRDLAREQTGDPDVKRRSWTSPNNRFSILITNRQPGVFYVGFIKLELAGFSLEAWKRFNELKVMFAREYGEERIEVIRPLWENTDKDDVEPFAEVTGTMLPEDWKGS